MLLFLNKLIRHLMMWIVLVAILIQSAMFGGSMSSDFRKNACKHLRDYPIAFSSPNCYFNPNVLSDVPSIISRSGYNFETHTIMTSDGYILTLFRLPPKNSSGQPVYLQHGILSHSAVWVDKYNQSLAFKLNDEGYDVWLGNIRGSTYSRKHRTLSYRNPSYWNFNLDTIAEIDIPAALNYIAKTTGRTGSIVYIGHSMGTTLSFMFTSGRPQEATSLLKGVISLAPVVYLSHNPVLGLVSPHWKLLRYLLAKFGFRAIFLEAEPLRNIEVNFCKMAPQVCLAMNDIAFGKSSVQLATEDLLVYFSYWPIASSVDQLAQYLQIANTNEFRKFDYGVAVNRIKYGQDQPPLYNLADVKLPVYLLYGANDLLTPNADIDRLYRELGSTMKKLVLIPSNTSFDFNHIAFIYSRKGRELLFPEILKLLKDLRDS